jgi:VIT1/CCC1 family predicted Fe2+/Mn2+ transporter
MALLQHRHQDAEHHRQVGSGRFRAAVFGMSDGLVSNGALILGMAGASASAGAVRTAGIAGLLAGASSMAVGEYLSMRAQAEVVRRELEVERQALRDNPLEERRELEELYRRRGVPAAAASAVAGSVMADEEVALEVHAREEFGVDPDELGSPVGAALSSFLAFVAGALLPLIPWLVGSGTGAVVASLVIAVVAAGALGAIVALAGGSSVPRVAARHVGLAAVATAITYSAGYAVG